jgi:3-hydroxy-9,10-secoandrosta-1,3,5(10)-triene-9,17-dione monooxygenase reductase component
MDTSRFQSGITPPVFRQVLRSLPTTVTVAAAMEKNEPIGMLVGSFGYVSMEPMLVGFFGDHRSKTLSRLLNATTWSFNVLNSDHDYILEVFRGPAEQRFAQLPWARSGRNLPLIRDCLMSIEAVRHSTVPTGDHTLVLAEVVDVHSPGEHVNPLLYHHGTTTTVHQQCRREPTTAGAPR